MKRSLLLEDLVGVAHADQRVSDDDVSVQVGERHARYKRSEPKRQDRHLRSHATPVDAEDATFHDKPAQQRHVVDLRARLSSVSKPMHFLREIGKGVLRQETDGLFGQGLRHLNEEMGAAARGIDDREGKELAGGLGRIGLRRVRDGLKMPFVGRKYGPLHEVPDDFDGGVVDPSGLSPALMGLPKESAGRDLGLLTGRDPYVPILPGVVLQGLSGQREPEAEERFVGVSDVGDIERREVGTATRLLILADRHEDAGEVRVGQFHPFKQPSAVEVAVREQRSIVGRHVPGRIAHAQGLDQPDEAGPERGRCGT